jgi:enoyl-CoA hydratase
MAAVEYEVQSGVAIVTLNRPEVRNAMSPEVLCRLYDAWQEVNNDDAVRVAVLTGAGDKAFCAGADLGRLIPLISKTREPEDEWDHRYLANVDDLGNKASLRIHNVDKPIIAACNGHAIAGGMELVQGTDIRVAAQGALFGVQEVKWALFPAGGSSVRLPVQLPYAIAMEFLLTGQLVDAQRAHELGFINHVVPSDQVLPKALEIAEVIAANGPLAVRTIKSTARALLGVPEAEAMRLESKLSAPVFASQDAVEGPRAFLEKRTPKFTGR